MRPTPTCKNRGTAEDLPRHLGPIAKHTARATFAKNFFEVGGIEAIGNTGFKDAASCAAGFKESGARIAILCSADPIYESMAEPVAQALKAAGCEYLLAGAPGEKRTPIQQRESTTLSSWGATFCKPHVPPSRAWE